MEWIAFFCIAAAIALVLYRLMSALFPKKDSVREDILVPDVFGPATEPMSRLIPMTASSREKLENELLGAGYFNSNALRNYLSIRNLAIMFVLIATALALFTQLLPPVYDFRVLLIGGIGAVLTYGLPRIVLGVRASSRRSSIERSFPDALDMIALLVGAGLPLKDSLRRVGNEFGETHPELARELTIISRQSDTGSIEHAMSSFSDRIDLPEISNWSALISQSQRLGGKLADSLLDCADRLRHQRKIRAEKEGNSASIKLLIPTVLCLAPPIFILLVGPAVLELREFINRQTAETIEIVEQVNNPSVATSNQQPTRR